MTTQNAERKSQITNPSPLTAIAFGLLAITEPVAVDDSAESDQRLPISGNLEEVLS